MQKGNIVRLNNKECFTTKNGGERRFPLINYGCDERGIISGYRHTTPAEQDEWREELKEAIRAGREVWHDCAGEHGAHQAHEY